MITPTTLHPLNLPKHTPPKKHKKLNDPNKDSTTESYLKNFLPISKTSVAKKQHSNKPAVFFDLVEDVRTSKQSDGTTGFVRSKIRSPLSNQLVPISTLEIDHFHCRKGNDNSNDGFLNRIKRLNNALSTNPAFSKRFVRNLQKQYPTTDDPLIWQWRDMIIPIRDSPGVYQIRISYQIRALNFPDNLWLIPGHDNKSFGNQDKIPHSGDDWTTSPLARKPLYGQDFFKLFGTVTDNIYERTGIDSSGIIDMATFSLNISTGEPLDQKLTGLGKIARDWFSYRFNQASQPVKELSLHLSQANRLLEKLDSLQPSPEKDALKEKLRNIFGLLIKKLDLV